MSDFQHIIRAGGGIITTSDGLTDPVLVSQGIPLEVTNAVAIDDGGVIDRVTQSLPFTAASRLAVALGGTVSRVTQGFPFDAAGRFVMEDAPIVRVDQGHPFTASGAFAANTAGFAVAQHAFQFNIADGTMFQDIAGTVPVTTPGEPVGNVDASIGGSTLLAPADDTTRPTFSVLRSNGAVQFTAASMQSLQATIGAFTSSDFSIYMALTLDAAAALDGLTSVFNNAGGTDEAVSSFIMRQNAGATGINFFHSPDTEDAALATKVFAIIEGHSQGTNFFAAVNGLTTAPNVIVPAALNADRILLAARFLAAAVSDWSSTTIGEVRIYAALTANQIIAVRNLLAQRWA